MVHISDGILSAEVLAAGWVITAAVLASTIQRIEAENIPKLSLITAAFFVASLIHIPLGPTSVHLILNGLVGITLGVLSFTSIFIGIVLQAFLLGHGGITTIGVNTMNMGLPALAAYGIFRLKNKKKIELSGGLAAGSAVILTVLLTALTIFTTGKEFTGVVIALTAAHVPIILVETIVTGSITGFLMKVKPELLNTT